MANTAQPLVSTVSGPVRGRHIDRIDTFLGIPYAAPPTGQRRWRAPQRPAPWVDPLACTAFGAAAPQPTGGPLGGLVPDMEPAHTDEDCLTCNVWTPGCDDAARAVLVWIHGGAFSIGASSLATYDGHDLAVNEDVVVVSVNYRLGALGWLLLDLPDTSPNAGLLDLVAALAWVRDNIAAFGGDPAKVTVFGESAGGGSVLSLLSAPAANGLFHRAIAQSGATDLVLSRDTALAVTDAFASQLGIDRHDLAAWQAVPVDELLHAQETVAAKLVATVGLMTLHPVADGAVMIDTWQRAASAGVSARVPLILGTTRHEMALFASMDPTASHLDDDGIERRLAAQGHPAPAAVLTAYRAADGADVAAPARWSTIVTDVAMWLPALSYATAYAAHQPDTWMYRFDWPSSTPGLGACHAIDIPFPFDAVERNGWGEFVADAPAAHALARTVQALWASFARGDDPVAPDAPEWPRFTVDERATLLLDRTPTLVHDPRAEVRTVWGG